MPIVIQQSEWGEGEKIGNLPDELENDPSHEG